MDTLQDTTTSLAMRLIDEIDDLRALAPGWNDLLSGSPTPTPFLSLEWLTTWWECFGEGRELRVVTLIDEQNTLRAAAPLVLERHKGMTGTTRILEILGTSKVGDRGMGLADRADFLVSPDRPEDLETLLDLIEEELEWDVLHLKAVPGGSPLRAALRSGPRGSRIREFPHDVSPYVPCEGTWEGYLSGKSKTFRKTLRKMRNRIRRLDGFELQRLAGAELCERLPEIFTLSEQSWKGDAGSALFASGEIRSFFERLASALAGGEGLVLWMFRIDEGIVAYELCLEGPSSTVAYDASYDPAHAWSSPGITLSSFILEDAFARGLEEYDQSRGDHEYKRRWSDHRREEKQIALVRPGVRAYAGYLESVGLKHLAKRLPGLPALHDHLTRRRSRT